MLDRLIKISSLSGAFLIFCGVLKLIIYYSAFSINIIDFLSLSEIVTSFLDDINILLIYGITMLIVSVTTVNLLHKKTNVKVDEVVMIILKQAHKFKYRYILFFMGIIFILWILIYYRILDFNYIAIYIMIFCVIQSLTFLVMEKDENDDIDIPSFSLVFSLVITITISVFLLAKHDIQFALKNEHSVTVTTDKLTIDCNKVTSNIYLGKTDGFAFIKIDSSKSCIVIPVSEITKFDFK